LADEEAALVEKAKDEGYKAVEAEWNELNNQAGELTSALKPWAEKIADGSISSADKSYYMKTVMPAASKVADVSLDMIDLMME
jgi:hypothetical protein